MLVPSVHDSLLDSFFHFKLTGINKAGLNFNENRSSFKLRSISFEEPLDLDLPRYLFFTR